MANKKNFEQEALKRHNELRKKHDVQALKLDRGLCSFAQEWANQLAISGKFEHRKQNKYGENLFKMWTSNPKIVTNGIKPVDNWYSEIKLYKFGKEPAPKGTGHFTQVIWKSTKKLGVAKAKSKDQKTTVVVANYDPPGNVVGRYGQNVPRLKK